MEQETSLFQPQLVHLRRNWPTTLVMGALVVSLATYHFLPYEQFATKYWPIIDTPIDYWGLIEQGRITIAAILLPIVLLAAITIITVWGLWKRPCSHWILTLSIWAIWALCAFLISIKLVLTVMLMDGTSLHHLETVRYKNNIYHLARGDTIAGGADVYFSQHLVYECGDSGSNCSLIHDATLECSYTSDCATRVRAYLLVDENKLYIEVDGGKTLVNE